MDTFDIRKYITENRINEMEYRIIVKDGDDFQEAFYSMDALKKKYPKGKKLEQGGIVHGYESLSGQRINETEMGDAVEFYMDYYDENEMPQEIRNAIADALEDGKSLEFIKGQIKNGFEDMVLPEGITEQEDVLEPEEDTKEDDEKKDDGEEVFPKDLNLKFIKKIEQKLAKNISANIDKVDEELINKKALAESIKTIRGANQFISDFVESNYSDAEYLKDSDLNDPDIINDLYGSYIDTLLDIYLIDHIYPVKKPDQGLSDIIGAMAGVLEDDSFLESNEGTSLYTDDIIHSYQSDYTSFKKGAYNGYSRNKSSLDYEKSNE